MATREKLIRTLEARRTDGSSVETESPTGRLKKKPRKKPSVPLALTSARSILREVRAEKSASTRSTPHPDLPEQPSEDMRAHLDRAREAVLRAEDHRDRIAFTIPDHPHRWQPNWPEQVAAEQVTDEEMDAIERARDALDAATLPDIEERALRLFGTQYMAQANARTNRRVWYTWNEETQQHEELVDPLDEEEVTRDEE